MSSKLLTVLKSAPNAAAVWTPASLAGLAPWLRGNLPASLLDGGGAAADDAEGVATWADQSGAGIDAAQATSGRRMQRLAARGCLTQNVDVFQSWDFTGKTFNARDFSLFVITKRLTTNWTYNGSTNQQYATWLELTGINFHLDGSTGLLQVYDGAFRPTTLRPPTSRSLIGVVGSTGALKHVLNGSDDTLAALPAGTPSLLRVGSAAAPDFPWVGEWHEVIGLDHAATPGELSLIRSYAQSRGCVFDSGNVVCYEGDSISTAAAVAQNRDWVYQLDYPTAPLEYNFSLGGRTLATINSENRSGSYYAAGKRNVLVVFAGTNDIQSGNATGTQAEAILNTFCTARRAQGFKVAVVTMLPRGLVEIQRQAFNNAIRANWTGYADALADVETLPMGAPGANNLATYYADGTHPNLTGYAALAGLIRPFVLGLMT